MATNPRRALTPEQREALRRKRHESRASSTYRTFVKTLCDTLPLPEDLAVRAATSVLCALEQRLIDDEASHLEAQLPETLRELLVRCERHEELRPRDIGRPEFLAMVAGDLGIPLHEAESVVRGVFRVLTVHVSAGELEDVIGMLPSDLRELWPPIPEDVHRRRGARPELRGRTRAREPVEEVVEDVLALSLDAQLGLLRTVVPRILAELDGPERQSFLRDLNEELERGDRGEPVYDIRASIGHQNVRH